MEQEQLAKTLGIKILDSLISFAYVKEKKIVIPYRFAKKHNVLPLYEKNNVLFVVTSDLLNQDSIKELQLLVKKEIESFYCPKETLDTAIESIYQQSEDTLFLASVGKKEDKETKEIEGYDLLEKATDNPVIRILNALLTEAILQKASDIHFEPMEEELLCRFRIDGVLQKRRSPPTEYINQILTRIKIMASLDIAETRLPQDGRIKLKMGRRQIDFRVSTLPVVFGERIVLRILDTGQVHIGLKNLEIGNKTLNKLYPLIAMPEGIILVTGPTGSGKTTTLYSALAEIDAKAKNIMTIEDPVEYKIQHIAQIAVNTKIDLTFAKGLRHILRQDPDVIMIGEIRDKETAQIAIQSALTGHLVFSTLHTNDAPSALTRLADMGIEPYLLSSSILGVLAQRLVRRICENCKEAYTPNSIECKQLGITLKKNCTFYRGKGCEHCFDSGYKGRIGIHELMVVTPKIKKQVIKSPDAEELRKIFLAEGCSDLRDSGMDLVIAGITTIEEVFRMTKLNLKEEV